MAFFRRKSHSNAVSDRADTCRKCGKVIEVDPAASVSMFEGMHWLCFHLEYEHEGDPDRACGDYSSCPWWTIRHYEQKLRELGLDPEAVLLEAIKREGGSRVRR